MNIITIFLTVYLIAGAIVLFIDRENIRNTYKYKINKNSFLDGFIYGLYIMGAIVCFPYYMAKYM